MMDLQKHLQQVDSDIANSALRVKALEAALAQEKERLLRLDGAKAMLETLSVEDTQQEKIL